MNFVRGVLARGMFMLGAMSVIGVMCMFVSLGVEDNACRDFVGALSSQYPEGEDWALHSGPSKFSALGGHWIEAHCQYTTA